MINRDIILLVVPVVKCPCSEVFKMYAVLYEQFMNLIMIKKIGFAVVLMTLGHE